MFIAKERSAKLEKVEKLVKELTVKEKRELLQKENPEIKSLLEEVKNSILELKKINETEVNRMSEIGKKYINYKYTIEWNFVINVIMLCTLKSEGKAIITHPVLQHITKLKKYKNTLKSMEGIAMEELYEEKEELDKESEKEEELEPIREEEEPKRVKWKENKVKRKEKENEKIEKLKETFEYQKEENKKRDEKRERTGDNIESEMKGRVKRELGRDEESNGRSTEEEEEDEIYKEYYDQLLSEKGKRPKVVKSDEEHRKITPEIMKNRGLVPLRNKKNK